MSLQRVKKQITEEIKDTEKRIEGFVRELELFIESYISRFMDDLEDGDEDPIARLGALLQGMKDAGLDSKLARIGELYGRELKVAMRKFESLGIDPLTVIDATTIEALVRFKVEQVQFKVIESVGNIRPLLLQTIILGEKPDIASIMKRVSGVPIHQIETELRTSMLAFNRTVTAIQAEKSGIERFVYLGPDDRITRDFCSHVLNERNPPVYTLDEILAMDNEQGLDVLQYGGGYNCRHEWQPITPELEEFL
jgi:hypothetical protein